MTCEKTSLLAYMSVSLERKKEIIMRNLNTFQVDNTHEVTISAVKTANNFSGIKNTGGILL